MALHQDPRNGEGAAARSQARGTPPPMCRGQPVDDELPRVIGNDGGVNADYLHLGVPHRIAIGEA